MDFIKSKMGGHKDQKEENQGQKQTQNQGQNINRNEGQSQASQGQEAAGSQKPDYIDKAFDAGAKKAGYNIDPNTREKITDTGRETFEKATGKDVPDKISH